MAVLTHLEKESKKVKSQIEIKQWGAWRIAWASLENLDQCQRLLKEKQIDGLGVSPHHGSDFRDLSHVVAVEGLTGLVLPFSQKMDLTLLNVFEHLRFIVVGNATGEVDLSQLSRLEDAAIEWSSKVVFPRSGKKLKRLRLDKFKPRSKSIADITQFSQLEVLELVQGSMTTLEYVEEFALLRHLELYYMASLQSVRALEQTNVAELLIDHCPKLADLASLDGCRNLRVLGYHDSADLPSIRFVNDCPALKEFRFVGVNVADGDMTPLLKLDNFAFTQKRHFSHTEKALWDMKK